MGLHAAYHRRIIGSIAELWDVDSPAEALGMIVESVAQTIIGTHTSCLPQ